MSRESIKSAAQREGSHEIGDRLKYHLANAIDYYGVSKKGIATNKKSLIHETANLLVKYEVTSEYLERERSEERLIFALAVQNTLHSESSEKEIRALTRVLKLMCWRYDFFEGEGSYSKRVLRASNAGLKVGTRFDAYPKVKLENSYDDHAHDNIELAKSHKDKTLTDALVARIRTWGPGTLLHEVRQRLGVSASKENEIFHVPLVTTLNKHEFSKAFNGVAFQSGNYIIFPKDASDHTVRHEYVHTQTYSIMVGLYNLLFRALNEIGTELLTCEAFKYSYQHIEETWLSLIDKDKKLEDYLIGALCAKEGKNEKMKDKLFKRLIGSFGLDVFLNIARIDTRTEREGGRNIIASSVYINPIRVRNMVNARSK